MDTIGGQQRLAGFSVNQMALRAMVFTEIGFKRAAFPGNPQKSLAR
jgi:hypothetical protein